MVQQQQNASGYKEGGEAVPKRQGISVIDLKTASSVLFNREDAKGMTHHHCFQDRVKMVGSHGQLTSRGDWGIAGRVDYLSDLLGTNLQMELSASETSGSAATNRYRKRTIYFQLAAISQLDRERLKGQAIELFHDDAVEVVGSHLNSPQVTYWIVSNSVAAVKLSQVSWEITRRKKRALMRTRFGEEIES